MSRKICILFGLYIALSKTVLASPEIINITREARELRIKIGLEEDNEGRIIEKILYISFKEHPEAGDIYRFRGLRDYGETEMISGKKMYIVWARYKDLVRVENYYKKGDGIPQWPQNQKTIYLAFGTNITPPSHKFVKYMVIDKKTPKNH